MISKLSYEVVSRPPLDWVLVLGFIIASMFIMIMFDISAIIIFLLRLLLLLLLFLLFYICLQPLPFWLETAPSLGAPGPGPRP